MAKLHSNKNYQIKHEKTILQTYLYLKAVAITLNLYPTYCRRG